MYVYVCMYVRYSASSWHDSTIYFTSHYISEFDMFDFSIYAGLPLGTLITIICSVVGGCVFLSVGCFGVYWTQYKRPESAETVHHESDDNMSGDFIPEILIDFPRISPTYRRPPAGGRAAQSFTPEVEALDSPGVPHSEGSDGVYTDSEIMIDSPSGIMDSPPLRTFPTPFNMESPPRRSPAKKPRPRRLSQIEVEALETYTKIFFPEPEVIDELDADDEYDDVTPVKETTTTSRQSSMKRLGLFS